MNAKAETRKKSREATKIQTYNVMARQLAEAKERIELLEKGKTLSKQNPLSQFADSTHIARQKSLIDKLKLLVAQYEKLNTTNDKIIANQDERAHGLRERIGALSSELEVMFNENVSLGKELKAEKKYRFATNVTLCLSWVAIFGLLWKLVS